MEYIEPWVAYKNSTEIISELRHEISSNHLLFEKEVELVARRIDCDDYLFKVTGEKFKYVVVHLTWSRIKETNPVFPSTDIYDTWDDFVNNRMKPDHSEYIL